MSKNKDNILGYLITISFVLLALFGSVHFWCFNENFYKKQHNNLMLYGQHIADYIGISEEDLADLTHITLAYLNDSDLTLNYQLNIKGVLREVYNDDEKLHMVDVQKLNITANYILIGTIIIFICSLLFYFINKFSISNLINIYKRVLIYTLMFVTVIGLYIFIDFDSFWTNFHHIFFSSNELWLLSLKTDILIMIVPPEFFFNLVTTIVITFLFAILLFVLLLMLFRKLIYGKRSLI